MSALPIDVIIPRDAELLSIVEKYYLSDEVHCGLANCRQAHKSGAVVAFRCDGVTDAIQCGVIGNRCAANNFGAVWIKVLRTHDAKIVAEKVAAAYALYQERAGAIIPAMRDALPRMRWHAETLKFLNAHAPDVMRMCGVAVRAHQGRLLIGSTVAHVLAGKLFWSGYSSPVVRANALVRQAEDFERYVEAGECTQAETDKHLARFVNLDRQWVAMQVAMADADAALGAEHLKLALQAVNRMILADPRPWKPNDSWLLDVRVFGDQLQGKTGDAGGRGGWAPVARLAP